MRRLLALVVLMVLTILAVEPALAGSSTPSAVTHGPSAAHRPHHCRKSKSGTKNKCVASKPATPTPVKPASGAPTLTSTSTPTPTPTATATPAPSVVTMPVRADLDPGYRAAFYVCGLPRGSAAVFQPNPAVSKTSPGGTGGAAAQSTLTLITLREVPPASYTLEIHASYKDASGSNTASPAGGGAIEPPGATLAVDASGNTSLSPLSFNPGIGDQNCSDIPPGFTSTPTPTPLPSDVAVYAAVSNPHPMAGEIETVTGIIQLKGQPVASVLIHTHWYFRDAVRSCDAVTGSNGAGSCSLLVVPTIPNQTILIQLIFVFNGQQYIAYTSFVT